MVLSRTPRIGLVSTMASLLLVFYANADSIPNQSTLLIAEKPSVSVQQASSTVPVGHPVTFVYGSGVSQTGIQVAMNVVSGQGCPVTAKQGGFPNRIIVKTAGKGWATSNTTDAAGWAIDHCKNQSQLSVD